MCLHMVIIYKLWGIGIYHLFMQQYLGTQLVKARESDQKAKLNTNKQPSDSNLSEPLPDDIIRKYEQIPCNICPTCPTPQEINISPKIAQKPEVIDLSELKQLIEISIDAGEKLTGKDVVIVVGKTGSGKSTLINFLAGIKLKAIQPEQHLNKNKQGIISKKEQQVNNKEEMKQEDEQGLRDFILVPEDDKNLQGFQIGHKQSSNTKFINTYEQNNLVLVDTPGLMDSNGVLYDIANAVGLWLAFCKASKVKFLLVISQNTILEGRGVDLRQLIQQFLQFVPELQLSEFLPSISVIISHSKFHKDVIIRKLKEISEQLSNDINPKVNIFIKEIVKKLQKKSNKKQGGRLHFVAIGSKTNMLNPDIGEDWKAFLKLCKPVQNPEKWFQISLKKNSIYYVQEKMIELNRVIRSLSKNYQFKDILQFISELEYFRKYIKLEQVDKNYKECIQCIEQSQENLKQQFIRNIQSNELSDQIVNSLHSFLRSVKQVDELNEILNFKMESRVTYKELCKQIGNKMQKIIQFVNQNINNLQNMSPILKRLQKFYLKFGCEIDEVAKIYENFIKQLTSLIVCRISSMIEEVKEGNYQMIIREYNFLNSCEDIFMKFYSIELKKYEAKLKQFLRESLKFRFNKGIKRLLNSKIDEVQQIKEEYQKWKKVLNNSSLDAIIEGEFLKNLNSQMESSLQKVLNNKLLEIKQKFINKKFEQLRQPLTTFNNMRLVDKDINGKLVEEYFTIIGKLDVEITNDFKQFLITCMRKINIGTINEEEMYLLKQKMSALKQMRWISQIIPKGNIFQIYKKVESSLESECKSLRQQIKNMINNEEVEQDRYKKLNNTLVFIKAVSQINENLAKQFEQAKKQIKMIIDEKINSMESMTSSKEEIIFNKNELGISLARLFNMKDIRYCNLGQIQKSISSACGRIQVYLDKEVSTLRQMPLSETENFNKTSTNVLSLLNSLQVASNAFKSKRLVIQTKKENLIQLLNHRFQNFFDELKKCLKENKLKQIKKQLQILKYYKSTDLKKELGDVITKKYEEFDSKYQKIIEDITRQVEKLFNEQKFSELKKLIAEHKKVNQDSNMVSIACRLILKQEQSIARDLTSLSAGYNVNLIELNKKINKFLSYKQIQQTIQQQMNYNEKKERILNHLENYCSQAAKKIIKNIEDLKFQGIKNEIQKLNQTQLILLMGIQKRELNLQKINYEERMKQEVSKILQQEIRAGQFTKFFNKYNKIKILDEQYNTEYCSQLKTKLKQSAFSSIAEQIKKILNCKEIRKYLSIKQEFDQLKADLVEGIGSNTQFNQITGLLKQKQKQFGSAKSQIHSNEVKYYRCCKNIAYVFFFIVFIFTAVYAAMYVKKQLDQRSTYQELMKKINKDLDQHEYIKVFDHLLQLDELKMATQNAEIFKNKTIFEVNQHKLHFYTQSMQQLKNRKLTGNFSQIRLFLYLQRNNQGNISEQNLTALYAQLQSYLSVIAQLDQYAPLKLKYDRLQHLKQTALLVDSLKPYVEDFKQNPSLFVLKDKLSKIDKPDQYQKKLDNQIKQVPQLINELWNTKNYKGILKELSQLKKLKNTKYEQNFEKISNIVKQLIVEKANQIEREIKDSKYANANEYLNQLKEAEKQLKSILNLSAEQMRYQDIVQKLILKIKKLTVDASKKQMKGQKKDMKKIVQKILQLSQWTNLIPSLQSYMHEYTSQIIESVKKQKSVQKLVIQIQERKTNSNSNTQVTYLNKLVFQFQKQLQIPRIFDITRITAKDAIDLFKSKGEKQINKVLLNNSYNIYLQQYEKQKQNYIAKGDSSKITKNLNKIKDTILQYKHNLTKTRNDNETYSIIPKVVANIFVYWSLSKSGKSFYIAKHNKKLDDAYKFLLQPHPIQVLSILRFVGCDKQASTTTKNLRNQLHFSNHIMQIKTGQGKSVILGVMSTLLSIMGHQVYCASYSKYLSERDFLDFKPIFTDLQVIDQIYNGTFNQIAERLINQKGDVRKLALEIFNQTTSSKTNKKEIQEQKRILLVDQVDTFFSRDFYGKTYNSITMIKNKQITEIIKQIWKNRGMTSQSVKTNIKKIEAYRKLSEDYKDIIGKLDRQFSIMIEDAKTFNSRDYVVQNDKIGYKQLDGISFTSFYGYQTMFAYIYESEPEINKINRTKAEEEIGIYITCGEYSYAEMVQKFQNIFGVTGTLQSLSEFESKILDRYKIYDQTYAPSVYGDSLRLERPILIQTNKQFHFMKIARTIEDDLKNKTAVLVFFENEKQLQEFQKSDYINNFRSQLKKVTEKTKDRNFTIKKATTSGTVTIFTAPFGRGTDFVVLDQTVKEKGVTVIQTFLSDQHSQQIQIKGRTARQGKVGSYQLILNLETLQAKYKITQQMIDKARQNSTDSVHNLLHRSRVKYLQQVNKEREKIVEMAKQTHQNSIAMKLKMKQKSISRDNEFFFNYKTVVSGKARVLCMIDATTSMTGTINQVKGKVMEMIDNLQKKYPKQFQIQLMFYYGTNAYDGQKNDTNSWGYKNKIHASQWSSDTNVLRKFMQSVSANGGNYHQSVQLALHHLLVSNQEVGVSKAILIGDDGLQTSSEMIYHVHPSDKIRYPGRQKQDIKLNLKYSQLLTQLKLKGVQVDTYPITDGRTFRSFSEIAAASGGKCKKFNPSTDNLSAQIQNTITECIVRRK